MKIKYPDWLVVILLLLVLIFLFGCQSTASQIAKIPGEEPLLQNDLDTALDLLEKESENRPQDGHVWLLLGEARIQLAERGIANGSSNLFINSGMEDAGSALSKAKELLPNSAKVFALQAKLQRLQGNSEAAYSHAEKAKALLQSESPSELKFLVEKVAAESSFQRYVELKQNNASLEEIAVPYSRTFRALSACEALRPKEAWAYEKLSDLLAWEGSQQGIPAVLKRGILQSPEQQSLHNRLVTYYYNAADLETLVKIYRDWASRLEQEPTTLWYYGLSCIHYADQLRRNEQTQQATAIYEESKRPFRKSLELQPNFQESVEHYLGMAEISKAWCRYQERQLDAAAQLWMEALRTNPGLKDKTDGLGLTAKQGLGRIGGEYVESKEFELGRKLFQDLSQIDPNDFEWMNNYAFLCRESGTALEAAGKKKEAFALFEESYAAYEKAVALMPEDSRTINDCALILLYHLNRDLEKAEAMFRRSIEIGDRILAEGSLESMEAESLRSAIGDAYQNIGVLYVEKKKSPFQAKPYFEKSLEVSSDSRPQVQWYLKRISQMEANMRQMLFWVAPVLAPLFSVQEGTKTEETPKVAADTNWLADEYKKVQEFLVLKQCNDALDLLDEIEKKSPNLADTAFLYGKTYLLKAETAIEQGLTGNNIGWAYSDAMRYLEKAVQLMPKNGEAYLLLGKAQFASNQIEAAAANADKACALMSKNAEAWLFKGSVAFQQYMTAREAGEEAKRDSMHKAAIDAYKTAAQVDPKSALAQEKIGDLLLWANKKEEAMDAYAASLGITPNEALAGRMFQTYDYSLWTKVFDKALDHAKKLRPENDKLNGTLHWYLGYSYYQSRQMESAKNEFQKALAANADLVTSHYYLGKLYYDSSKFVESAESFAKYAKKDVEGLARIVRESDPDPDRLKAVLAFLENDSYQKQRGDTARELARLNAHVEPDKAERWNNYGFLSRETRKYEESYTAYSKAVELDPENPRLLNDCALILQYHLHRELDKAKTMYEKAITTAQAIINDPESGPTTKESARSALIDASSNLARLKVNPQGEKGER